MRETIWVSFGFVVIPCLLIRFVPRYRLREAFITFLFNQMFTWSIGTLLYQSERIISPVRPFPHATNAYFWDGYVFYPAISVLYYFSSVPPRRHGTVAAATAVFALVYVLWEYVEITWTDVKRYENWTYAHMLLTVSAVLLLTRWFTLIFFREKLRDPV